MKDIATKRKIALGLSALAIAGMGSITVACSPRTEKPAEPSVSNTAPPAEPTEKNLQTNVTRAPMSAGPQRGGGGNPAVPCGFGPQGGARCGGY
jgi:hypothetical protein